MEAGGVTVVVPPHALECPRWLHLMVVVSDEMTDVKLGPNLHFAKPVLIDFGTTPVVYFWEDGQWITVYTIDTDQDGEVGEIFTDHFSRWA